MYWSRSNDNQFGYSRRCFNGNRFYGTVRTIYAPKMPALPGQEPIKQAQKSADASVANRIKATKSKMGSVATPRTMLSGTMGVGDEELNLGGKSWREIFIELITQGMDAQGYAHGGAIWLN